MFKKLLFVLTMVISLFVITSCTVVSRCIPVEEWSNDETTHWHKCSTSGCNIKLEQAKHTYSDWNVIEEATIIKSENDLTV